MQFSLITLAAVFASTALASPAGVYGRQADTSITQSCNATSAQTYTVVSGDTLTTIAAQYGVGVCDIAAASGISNPNFIDVGQVLTIPAGVCTPDNSSCLPPTTTPTATCVTGPPNSYLVRSGDTGSAIASNFNITLDALTSANSGIDISALSVNQLLTVPVCDNSRCTVETYTLVAGDTFFDLAAASGSTVGQVLAFNQALNPTTLPVGQQILLPKDCTLF